MIGAFQAALALVVLVFVFFAVGALYLIWKGEHTDVVWPTPLERARKEKADEIARRLAVHEDMKRYIREKYEHMQRGI